MVVLITLAYWVISREAAVQQRPAKIDLPGTAKSTPTSSGAGIWTQIFAYYSLFIHTLVFIFPIRACYALWDVTNEVKRGSRSQSLSDFKKNRPSRRGSHTSLSSGETLTSEKAGRASTASSELGSDSEQEPFFDDSDSKIIHAIVIPNYKEEIDTLKETLDVLASHPQAQSSYDVCVHFCFSDNLSRHDIFWLTVLEN